jgi:hypothetical protein
VYLFWKKQLQIALNLNVFCRNTEIEMMMKTLVSSMIPSDRPYGEAGLIPDWSTNRGRCSRDATVERPQGLPVRSLQVIRDWIDSTRLPLPIVCLY